jgi:hypothetical protein
MTYRYGVYGLTIVTNWPIEGMLPPPVTSDAGEVTIDFDGVGDLGEPSHEPLCLIDRFQKLWQLDGDRYLLRYQSWLDAADAWTVTIARDRMTIRWSAGIDPTDIPTVLQGGALACLLLLRDVPALHAAAIDTGNGAILVLGDSGAGKSTTAASLIRAGHRLVADDTAALEERDGEVVVHPGLPRLRILEDSARALGWNVAELPPVFQHTENARKWFIDGGTTSNAPLKVRAIYILRQRVRGAAETRIVRLRAAKALGELLRHSHASAVPDRAHSQTLFTSLRRIAELVPMHEVHAADALNRLNALAATLVAHA